MKSSFVRVSVFVKSQRHVTCLAARVRFGLGLRKAAPSSEV